MKHWLVQFGLVGIGGIFLVGALAVLGAFLANFTALALRDILPIQAADYLVLTGGAIGFFLGGTLGLLLTYVLYRVVVR
ncbi:MAG: hypothetical protein AB1733_13880 [Thermodesulfobacteriota bacterium]